MTTVTITGTGTPIATATAGPGVLVRHGNVALQFDCGRGTTMRLAEIGVAPGELDAVFITHHHSDHVVGLSDLLMTRWIDNSGSQTVVAPTGPATDIIGRLLDPWEAELSMRQAHRGYSGSANANLVGFDPSSSLQVVWQKGRVTVEAMLVDHGDVIPAVGYRVATPDRVVAVSGDATVGDALATLAQDADVFVCEAYSQSLMGAAMPDPGPLMAYHASATEVGALADEAGVDTLMLTHLIPPPVDDQQRGVFAAEVRSGGFSGNLVVATDLTTA